MVEPSREEEISAEESADPAEDDLSQDPTRILDGDALAELNRDLEELFRKVVEDEPAQETEQIPDEIIDEIRDEIPDEILVDTPEILVDTPDDPAHDEPGVEREVPLDVLGDLDDHEDAALTEELGNLAAEEKAPEMESIPDTESMLDDEPPREAPEEFDADEPARETNTALEEDTFPETITETITEPTDDASFDESDEFLDETDDAFDETEESFDETDDAVDQTEDSFDETDEPLDETDDSLDESSEPFDEPDEFADEADECFDEAAEPLVDDTPTAQPLAAPAENTPAAELAEVRRILLGHDTVQDEIRLFGCDSVGIATVGGKVGELQELTTATRTELCELIQEQAEELREHRRETKEAFDEMRSLLEEMATKLSSQPSPTKKPASAKKTQGKKKSRKKA